jgi:hypothetical protein
MTKNIHTTEEEAAMNMENTTEFENARQLEVIQAVKEFNPELIKSCYAVGLWIWAEFPQRLSQRK